MARLTSVASLLVLALVVAGCSDRSPDDGDQPPMDDGSPTTGNDANSTAPDGSAPSWQVGQSWTWSVESVTSASTREVTTAVASIEGGAYSVGTTDVDEAAQVLPFHVVPLGLVQSSDLSWEAHGDPVSLLRFPLTDGATWTADFWSAPGADVTLDATNVTFAGSQQPGFQVNVTFAGTPDSLFLQAEYSTELGQFVRIATYFGQPSPFTQATLTAHGPNATGVVPFLASDLVRRPTNAEDPSSYAPQQVQVAAASELVILACFLSGEQGVYGADVVQSNGDHLSCSASNPGTTQYIASSSVAAPGTAVVSGHSLGQGNSNIEVFEVDTGEAA